MASFFFDSSALLKRYILEPGTNEVIQLLQEDHQIGVSRFAHVEVTATIVRRAKGGDIEKDDASEVLDAFEDEFRARFNVTEVNGPTLTRAVDLVRTYALKAADAIQLACLLAAASGVRRDEFTFVCSDTALNAAAKSEGIRVLDPTISD